MTSRTWPRHQPSKTYPVWSTGSSAGHEWTRTDPLRAARSSRSPRSPRTIRNPSPRARRSSRNERHPKEPPMRFTSVLIPLLLTLGSCSSPPKPPTVDESHKRPANATLAVNLQVCEGELQNTRIAARESARESETEKATAIGLALQQKALAAQVLRMGNQRN